MKPQDDEPASGPEKPSKPSRTEEARRIVEEHADDLRKEKSLKSFASSFADPTSVLFHFEPCTKVHLRHL
jgi:hypothetical protein